MPELKNRKPVNILIVEDDELALHVAHEIILSIGKVNVFTAQNGKEALHVIETTQIDLLVTDIMMPEMDGFELVQEVQGMPSLKDLYIIIITALNDVKQKVKGLDLGANDYIIKPFNFDELKARITAGIRTVVLRKELRNANAQLEKAMEFKRLILGRVAHDLRTPISIIDGYLSIIRDSFDHLTRDEMEVYFDNINNQSKYINSICRDIFDFTAIDMGKLNLNTGIHPLEPVVKQAALLNKPYVDAKNIRLNINNKINNTVLKIDPDRMTGVFWNIINNAVKFSPENDSVNIDIFKNAKYVEVHITDHGKGMTAEEKKNLFEFFASGSHEKVIGPGSVGLGLAISKKLVEMHGGKIAARSEEGKGSTFILTLPMT
ncbi:MAG: hybrid sensor histidine kinase/response regulator [Candidatus Eremiobacteraeota bacterium]|nr:hybrid sensor histidine kinase/response regulator [Candidatus Eremiobacteraeota bacterium]